MENWPAKEAAVHVRTGGIGRVSPAGDAAGVRRAGGGVRGRTAPRGRAGVRGRVRAELGATVLWEQLARRVGNDTTVLAGTRTFRGTVLASYPEFLVLRAADGAEHLIRYGSAVSIALPAEPPPLRPAPATASRRYQFALALRELARRREPIRALLADGTSCDGTVEAVGSDYLEIAEHHIGEARRRGAVRARRFIGFAAVVAVSLPRESR